MDSLQGTAPANLQNPVEVEKTIFEKSKSGVSFIVVLCVARARCMLRLKNGENELLLVLFLLLILCARSLHAYTLI